MFIIIIDTLWVSVVYLAMFPFLSVFVLSLSPSLSLSFLKGDQGCQKSPSCLKSQVFHLIPLLYFSVSSAHCLSCNFFCCWFTLQTFQRKFSNIFLVKRGFFRMALVEKLGQLGDDS